MFCETKGVVVLDNEGRRIYSKYYNPPRDLATHTAQQLFEQQLHAKTLKTNPSNQVSEVLIIEPFVAVFKILNDVTVYLLGDNEENEILLASLLDSLTESLEMLYKGELDRRRILEEVDLLVIAVDESFEDGLVMCCDAMSIVERVVMREGATSTKTAKKEGAFERAIQNAKDAITKTLMR